MSAAAIQKPATGGLLLAAEFCALTALTSLFVVRGLIPAWNKMLSDFPNYYIVARLVHEHYALDRIYDWIWLQRIKDHWSIPQELVGFVGLTPFSALPIVPLSWLEALTAKRVWLAFNLVLLCASLYGLECLAGIKAHRVALIALLAIVPLRNHFLAGQMHLVVLALLILAFWLDVRGRQLSCGVVLAFAAALKVYPLLFVLYFLRKRQWRAAAALVGVTLLIAAASAGIFGAPATHAFFVEQLPRMLRGEATDPFSLRAPSASTLFHRIFLTQSIENPQPLLSSPPLFAIFYPLWQLLLLCAAWFSISPQSGDARRSGLEWATWICLLLTLSTEPASYHRVALIFTAVLAFGAIDGVWRKASVLACYFVACNAHPSVSPANGLAAVVVDSTPYWALLALLAWLLMSLRTSQPEASVAAFPLRLPRLAWALAAFGAIWASVSATTLVHAKALDNAHFAGGRSNLTFAEYAPHAVSSHILTVAMRSEGYRIEDEAGRLYRTALDGVEDDQLAIGSSPQVDRFWIEAVSTGRSRLVELQLAAHDEVAAPIATIADGESPALSPDGRTLVFLRETKDAGTAWLVSLDAAGNPLSAPVRLSPPGMDVRSASIVSQGAVLVSASVNGTQHLFSLRPGAQIEGILPNFDASGMPVVNDANTMRVYQRRDGGHSRLYLAASTGPELTQITFGDCNAYDPAWLGAAEIVYVSDCGRGNGLGALAEIAVTRQAGNVGIASARETARTGDAQR